MTSWGWLFTNIVVPVLLPALGITLLKCTPLKREARKKAHWFGTIQDGQLAWIAVTWSAAALYEAFIYINRHPTPLWLIMTFVAEIGVILGGVVVASSGAVTAGDKQRGSYAYTYSSMIITVVSGALFYLVHTSID